MKKVAILLKVTDFDHCVAHSIHLLTTDSMTREPVIVDLLQKNKTIVRTQHFKTEIIEKEVQIGNDFIADTELLDKINDIKSLLDANENNVLEHNNEELDDDENSARPDIFNVAIGTLAADKGEQKFFCNVKIEGEIEERSSSKRGFNSVEFQLSDDYHYPVCIFDILEYLRSSMDTLLVGTEGC